MKYIEDFRNISKNVANCRSEDLIVGDFNYSGVKSDELVRQKNDESCFLQLLKSLDVFQMERSPSHISGNSLNFLSTTSDDTTYMTTRKSFSDQYPTQLIITVDYTPPNDVTASFSKSLFRLGTLNYNFSSLYNFISTYLTYNEEYLANWLAILTQATNEYIQIKRSKRVMPPELCLSHTMHLTNMRNSSRRKIFKS